MACNSELPYPSRYILATYHVLAIVELRTFSSSVGSTLEEGTGDNHCDSEETKWDGLEYCGC